MHPFREGFTASAELTASTQRALDAIQANEPAAAALSVAPAAVRDSLPLVLAGSDFVGRSCARDEKLLADLIARNDLQCKLSPGDFAARAPALPPDVATQVGLPPESEMLMRLRCWRRHEIVRIAWRDLAGWADLAETLKRAV